MIGPQNTSQSIISNDLIIIGNCLRNLEKRGIFISGCPPISNDLVEAIRKL